MSQTTLKLSHVERGKLFDCHTGLLAGKLDNICTAFPLTTFWTKMLRGYPLGFFSAKRNKDIPF